MLLPETAWKEALEFTGFLILKYGKTSESAFWQATADHDLKRIWENPEDDRYNELLKV